MSDHYKSFNRTAYANVLKHKFVLHPSFNVYNGCAGLIDLGPIACGLRNRLIAHWRKSFTRDDNVYEIDSPVLTKEEPLRASGHVQKFCDFVADDENGAPVRLDHYFEERLGRELSNMRLCDYEELLKDTKLTNPRAFNLMFKTSSLTETLYLRPETAQGHFVNFSNAYAFNLFRLPFATAMVGSSFRNEINPKNLLMRTREFCMAELEYFTLPNDTLHPDYERLRHTSICWLAPSDSGDYEQHATTIDELHKTVQNQILCVYIAKTQRFLEEIGIIKELIRFRRHNANEMAHYAKDCWDAELYTLNGWVECVGIANRGSFDLTMHSKHSNTEFTVCTNETEERTVQRLRYDKKQVAAQCRAKTAEVLRALDDYAGEPPVNGRVRVLGFEIEAELVCETQLVKKSVVPEVIEPSFGINRIVQVLLEHSFVSRDAERSYFRFNHRMCWRLGLIVSVCKAPEYLKRVQQLLKDKELYLGLDLSTASIGKKYARADELGIAYCVTVDSESLSSDVLTIRFRDTMEQIYVALDELAAVMKRLQKTEWSEVAKDYRKRE